VQIGPIRQYLADKADGDALFARDPQKRADVVRGQCREGRALQPRLRDADGRIYHPGP
jgi:hypothetical protein